MGDCVNSGVKVHSLQRSESPQGNTSGGSGLGARGSGSGLRLGAEPAPRGWGARRHLPAPGGDRGERHGRLGPEGRGAREGQLGVLPAAAAVVIGEVEFLRDALPGVQHSRGWGLIRSQRTPVNGQRCFALRNRHLRRAIEIRSRSNRFRGCDLAAAPSQLQVSMRLETSQDAPDENYLLGLLRKSRRAPGPTRHTASHRCGSPSSHDTVPRYSLPAGHGMAFSEVARG